MHLRPKRKKIKLFILIPIVLIILFVFLFVKFVNIKPLIISYSEMQAGKFATLIINSALKEDEALENEDLYKINNNIIIYNTKKINEILTTLTARIQKYFKAIEIGDIDNIKAEILEKYNDENLKKGIVLNIPMGYLTGSSFLANSGPKIPFRIKLIGDVKTDIKSSVTDYGLNNALLKIYIYVEVTTKSIIPFISSTQKTVVEYPLVLKLVEGKVPSYYVGNR